jgi:chaperonin GroES
MAMPPDQLQQMMMAQQGPQAPQLQQQAPMQPQQQEMPEEQGEPQESPQEDNNENYMDYALSQANLAKKLNKSDTGKELLDTIGNDVFEGYVADEVSRQHWLEKNKKWLELALLLAEEKTWPWPRAANIKYPLVATAAMQFSARAYPALVPADGSVVKAKISAKDVTGELTQKAARVARHMSHQVMNTIPKWEEDMDKLLMTMAISGIAFKKTFHNGKEDHHESCLIHPENLVVNYWAKTLEKAYRKTEILYYNKNEVREKQLYDEEFLDIDLPDPGNSTTIEVKTPVATDVRPATADKSTPHTFLACHTYWDLDDDGYEEPYIITIHKDTKKVVRIIARWDSDGVTKDADGNIQCIHPVEYFTAFPFIPNPDGSIYGCGFGMLLGSLNNAANTIINQLIDAGTMSNLQSGFIGRNLRIKEGQLQLRPNEWKVVNATGEDLQKSIYPIPAKEPSNVLMSLLQMLITSGNQLASIAEIFVGKMPGQNTPATTTQETIQQGMAVFTAVYKRVYRSLQEEFRKIFRLNRITPGVMEEEQVIAGEPISESDYEGTEKLIIPGGDPSGDSTTVKLQKLQQVGSLIQLGTINVNTYTTRVLEANDVPNPQELQQQPPPPQPDPKMQTEQMKQQTMQQKAQIDQQQAQIDQATQMQTIKAKERLLEIEAAQKAMQAEHERQMNAISLHNDDMSKKLDLVFQTLKAQQDIQTGNMKAAHQDAMAKRQMARDDQLHNQEMKLQAKAAKAKPKA